MSRIIREIPQSAWARTQEVWSHGYCLYVIEEQNVGPVKVGVATHPIRRLSTLQCGNPRHLYLRHIFCGTREDCRFIEGAVHFHFSGSILRGEWIGEHVSAVVAEITPWVAP